MLSTATVMEIILKLFGSEGLYKVYYHSAKSKGLQEVCLEFDE